MSDVILKVENVSKLYRLGTVGSGTFGGDVQRFWKTKILGQEDPFTKVGQTNDRTSKDKADFVWALKDINFEVKRGEVLGIIGKNGAGKSTLLKLLSRITTPTTGSIKSAGRMASLLEVGTGFHPELTGRENIFLNGAILGMTKKEIQGKFDEIVDFSGCDLYIDTPTKRYSSGMTVRLGFAVAAFLDPEILVVDEVLAVGDAEFQKKAIGKMQQISKGEGRTVLFVSHNMESVRQLCTSAISLKNGTIFQNGNVARIINSYLEGDEFLHSGPIYRESNWKRLKYENFQKGVSIASVTRLNSEEIYGEYLELSIVLNECDPKLITYVGFHINDTLSRVASGIQILGALQFENHESRIQIDLGNLIDGDYYMTIWVGHVFNGNKYIDHDLVTNVVKFSLIRNTNYFPWDKEHWGKIRLNTASF